MLGYLLIFIREWVLQTLATPHHVLFTLSERYSAAATQLGLRHVPRLFDVKHGSITGMHFRTLAEVVEVITQDFIPPASLMGRVIGVTVDWYWACRAKSFTVADIAALQGKCDALAAAWTALDTNAWRLSLKNKPTKQLPKGCVLNTIKFHRAVSHCADYVKEWGPLEYITTETSEALHKPLKIFFRSYVLLCVLCVRF